MSYDKWNLVPSSDRVEMAQSRRHTRAMKLLRAVEENLDPSCFTFEEIQQEFNVLNLSLRKSCGTLERGEIGNRVVQYGQSHLGYLVEVGICEQSDDGSYYVCHYDPTREWEED